MVPVRFSRHLKRLRTKVHRVVEGLRRLLTFAEDCGGGRSGGVEVGEALPLFQGYSRTFSTSCHLSKTTRPHQQEVHECPLRHHMRLSVTDRACVTQMCGIYRLKVCSV